jgi:hypothetical protein
MNIYDYLFLESHALHKEFVLGPKEVASFEQIFEDSFSLAGFLYNEAGENNNILLISPNSVFFITG